MHGYGTQKFHFNIILSYLILSYLIFWSLVLELTFFAADFQFSVSILQCQLF